MTRHDALAKPKTMTLTSPAFVEGDRVPPKFTCDGYDVSPALRIVGAPPGAKALALVMDDPDAPRGTWTHWTLWDLPPATSEVPEAAHVEALGAKLGMTDSGAPGWGGPCPPSGTHRYFFRVFALDAPLGLGAGASVADVWAALAKRTLAWGELMGTYSRKR